MVDIKHDSKLKKIRDLKGLGPKSEEMLAAIKVTSVDQFLCSDPFELYALLQKHFNGMSLNMLYAMIGAQEGIPWQDVKNTRKTQILMLLDDRGLI